MVSIILTTYNGAKFITQAIESVLTQSFRDFELLVIDDGSTDNTAEVVKKYSRKDPRIIYLKNENNLGIQKSLNRCLKEARGEWVARIDDDDIWVDPEKLRKQAEFLNASPDYVLVGTGVIMQNEAGLELFRFLNPESDKDIREKLLVKNCFIHSSVVFRKDVAFKFGGYSEKKEARHVEDYDLWLKLGTIGKMANLPIYSVRFTLRPGSISSENKSEQFKKNIIFIKKYKDQYPNYWQAIIWGYFRWIFYKLYRIIPLTDLKNKILKIYKEG